MRDLRGVVLSNSLFSETTLKHLLLFFDKLTLVGALGEDLYVTHSVAAAIDFLVRQGVADVALRRGYSTPELSARVRHVIADQFVHYELPIDPSETEDVVPIYDRPAFYDQSPPFHSTTASRLTAILKVGLTALPKPDQTAAFQDILDFKAALHDKQWGFRRFLKRLATKEYTAYEIRDEVEWLIGEYTKAMKIHHLKATQSFVDIFIVSPVEIIENLAKLNWSKVAKGVLSVKKRNVDLLEAEMNAPGRECAYVFDARKRFGKV